jgi:hypothetical protein
LAAAREKLFRVVGEKAEMPDPHKPARKDMQQEAAGEFLHVELHGLELIPVFSIAVSEGNLSIVDC